MHNLADRLKLGRTTAFAGLFWLTAVGSAAAAEPCGDTSCPKGYACEEVSAPCPDIACAPGSECPSCDGTVLACVPESCSSDSDCEEDMVCLTQTSDSCSGAADAPACAPGASCPEPAPAEPVECTTRTTSQCVPRWSLPCNTDASCGEGFSCVERESCGCSGSSGGGDSSGGGSSGGATPPSRPGAEPAPPSDPDAPSDDRAEPTPDVPPSGAPQAPLPPDCSCEPSGIKACVPDRVACDADSDCPSGWSCGDNPEGVCWSGPNGAMGCEPGDPPKLCLPPYRDLGGGYPGRGETSNDAGSPTGAPPAAPGFGEDTANESASGSNGDADSGGCTLAAGPTPGSGASGLGALGALVALVFGRSVRARRAR